MKIKLDRAALKYIKVEYQSLSQFMVKPGVIEFILTNGQSHLSLQGIFVHHVVIVITKPIILLIQLWMSV